MAAISLGSPPATIVRLHLPQLDLAVFRYLIPHLLPRGAIRLQQVYQRMISEPLDQIELAMITVSRRYG
ncbi:hypothetical protein EJB05_05811 [Eragrostis curvula]|uniref:Uncharacterized protein n=1 Tax=Eragrostis curvula TaxID=38414 RepID=A0A5J9WEB7_9POAL|nr:hypothetical protein EJB05_05811 [Eragrostis curvula]